MSETSQSGPPVAAQMAAQMASPDPGEGLRAVAALRRLSERLERLQVQRARAAGWSWQEIAAALGVSKQAAHRKHSGPIAGGSTVAGHPSPGPARAGVGGIAGAGDIGGAGDDTGSAPLDPTVLGPAPISSNASGRS